VELSTKKAICVALAQHDWNRLFLELLGWDSFDASSTVAVGSSTYTLRAVARKRGVATFAVEVRRSALFNEALLAKLLAGAQTVYHECVLIAHSPKARRQVWQWVVMQGSRRVTHRERPFSSRTPRPLLLQRLWALAVAHMERDRLGLLATMARVRATLEPMAAWGPIVRQVKRAAHGEELAAAAMINAPGAMPQLLHRLRRQADRASAKLVRRFGFEPDDAGQIVALWLIQGVHSFRPERGYRFTTFAEGWLQRSIRKYSPDWLPPTGLPAHVFLKCNRLHQLKIQLTATLGEAGSREPFGNARDAAGISVKRWRCYELAAGIVRFSELDRRVLRRLGHPESPNDPFSGDVALRDLVHRGLENLPPHMATILRLRYGFDEPEQSLQQIGDAFDVTRERIRQLQLEAEKRLARFFGKSMNRPQLELHDMYLPEETGPVNQNHGLIEIDPYIRAHPAVNTSEESG